jgi:hypothetical protein
METVMEQYKTPPLEQAWLHVIEGEAQVTAQILRIGELLSLRKDTTEADAVFDALDDKLRILREKLEQEQAEAARRRT